MDRRTFNKLAGLAGISAVIGAGGAAEVYAAVEADKGTRTPWDHYFMGTAYYPEWWEPSEWENDFR